MENIGMTFLIIIIQVVIGLIIVIIGYLTKRSINQIDKRLETGDQKFKDICGDIAKIKEQRGLDREYFAKEYVSKDDFIRDIRSLDYKIDQVAADVKKLLTYSGRRDDHGEI